MKNFLKFPLIIFLILILNGKVFSQAGSVELRNTGGIISTHSSIQEAYNAIPLSISQAYIIQILSSYTGASEMYPIIFSSRTGSSLTNTITVRPALGVANVTISSSLNNNAIITFDGADYVILDGRAGGTGTGRNITVSNLITAGTSSNTINLINGATNNIVRNCVIINGTQNSAGPRTVSIGTAAANPEGNSDNQIINNVIDGGRTGVGINGTAANANNNNLIKGNDIKNWGFAGIWHQTGTNNTVIDSNAIYQTAGFNITNPSAISLATTSQYTVTISNNKIYNVLSSSTSTGLTIRGIYTSTSPGAGSELLIYNNFVALPDNNNNAVTVYGMLFTGTNAYTVKLFYNSVNIAGTHVGGGTNAVLSAGIFKNSTNAGGTFEVKNNICVNTRSGGVMTGFHTGAAYNGVTSNTLAMDYNVYFADAIGNGAVAFWEGVNFSDSVLYRTAATPQEQNTRFRSVLFTSAIDLHLSGSSLNDLALRGTPIPGITRDIDGHVRNTLLPSRGADEVALVGISNLNLNPDSYSLSQNYPNPFNPSTQINFSILNTAMTSLIVYDVSGKEVAKLISGNLAAGSYSYTFNGNNLTSGVYFYRLTSGQFTETKSMMLIK